MIMLPLASLTGVLLGWLMAFLSLFLIMLILIQRGKGGGLTGALGGPGGQSAFGSKAGDTFTAITIVVASLWGLTCVITMLVLGDGGSAASATEQGSVQVSEDAGDEDLGGELLVTPANEELSDDGELSGGTDEAADAPAVTETPSADLVPNDDADAEEKSDEQSTEEDDSQQEAEEPAASE